MEFVAFWRGDKLREAQLFQENDPAAGWWWFVVFQRQPYSSRSGEEGETMIIVSSFRRRPEIPPNDFIRPAKNERKKERKEGRSEMEKRKGKG